MQAIFCLLRIAAFAASFLLIWFFLKLPAGAHFADRPDLDKWFSGLSSKRGLCCSFADGVAISDVDWDTQDGHYRVRLNGEWIVVPDDAVIESKNRYGPAVVWPIFKYNSQDVQQIRCFMPGAGA